MPLPLAIPNFKEQDLSDVHVMLGAMRQRLDVLKAGTKADDDFK
jgi:hypothetical protein